MKQNIAGKKLKSNALQYVLFIAVLIALLLSAFIMTVYLQQHFKLKSERFVEDIHQVNSAIMHAFSHSLTLDGLQTSAVSSIEMSGTPIRLSWKQRGIMGIATAETTSGNETVKQIALLGGYIPPQKRLALYLEKSRFPLVLMGDSRISGVCYLPPGGVKKGVAAGAQSKGTPLFNGTVKNSNALLPQIKAAYKNDMQRLVSFYKSEENSVLPEGVSGIPSLSNSFYRSAKVLHSKDSLHLDFVKLCGNIIVSSDVHITVAAGSRLRSIVLIAPEITIQSNTKGSFQAFATKRIIIGSNCDLRYPTVLAVMETLQEPENVEVPKEKQYLRIAIDENTKLRGIIYYDTKFNEQTLFPQVCIAAKAHVLGEVYCQRNLELKGKVTGSIYTHRFVAKINGIFRPNHIYGGTIRSEGLPETYCGLPFDNRKQRVVQWLY